VREITPALNKSLLRSHTEIVRLASSFLSFWAELQTEEEEKALEEGAEALKSAAATLTPQVAE
jgi:hypothetical protein